MKDVLIFLSENWKEGLGLSLILLPIILRVIPTEKNKDILRFVFEILDKIIPNIKKGGGTHALKVIVFLMLIGGGLSAQNNSVFKGAVSINTDSAAFKTYIASQQTTYGSLGALYYNEQTEKWRVYYDSAWHDLIQPAGSSFPVGTANQYLKLDGTLTPVWQTVSATSPITFNAGTGSISTSMVSSRLLGRTTALSGVAEQIQVNNALTLATGNLRLGGSLVEDTQLDGGGTFDLSLGGVFGLDQFNILGEGATITAGALDIHTSNAIFEINGDLGGSGDALVSDGAGGLVWGVVGGGTPAGSNTQVQFNNAGVFGADSDLTFVTDRLTATNTTVTTDLRLSTLTSGRVPFITTSGAFTDEANFEYDAAGNRMSVNQLVLGGTNPTTNTLYSQSGIQPADPNLAATWTISGSGGISGNENGQDIVVLGGAGFTTSGNGRGGDVNIQSGTGRSAGTGRAGDISLLLPTTGATAGSFVMQGQTAGGTGAVSINTPTGQVRFAGGATTLVVTNSSVKITDMIFCTVLRNDATAQIKNVVAAAGSFTITLSAAATAETYVGFFVIDTSGN